MQKFTTKEMQTLRRWHGTPPMPKQCAQALETLEETIGDF